MTREKVEKDNHRLHSYSIGRGTEKEIIHILKERAGFEVESCAFSSKDLSKEVRAIFETLGRTVHVSCKDWRISGSVHMKMKRS